MGQLWAVDEEGADALDGQVRAVAQMQTLEIVGRMGAAATATVATRSARTSQGADAAVSDVAALDQANALQLGKLSEERDGLVGEIQAAGKVDIANSVAILDKMADSIISDAATVAQVQEMQVFAELGDG